LQVGRNDTIALKQLTANIQDSTVGHRVRRESNSNVNKVQVAEMRWRSHGDWEVWYQKNYINF